MYRWILIVVVSGCFGQSPLPKSGATGPETIAPKRTELLAMPAGSPQESLFRPGVNPLTVATNTSLPIVTKESMRVISLSQSDGGSVVTRLGGDIAVNKNSTLTRRWFTLNDSSCPVRLTSTGVQATYTSERFGGRYSFKPAGAAHAIQGIRAVSVTFVIFDIWGDRMRNLGLKPVMDVDAGYQIPFDGSWYASENDVESFYTSLVFVDAVMRSDGSIWRADRKAISGKLSEIQIRVSEAGLDREPPKDEPKKP